jgi:hypothetical protein
MSAKDEKNLSSSEYQNYDKDKKKNEPEPGIYKKIPYGLIGDFAENCLQCQFKPFIGPVNQMS